MEDGDCGAPTVPAPLNHEVDVTVGGVLANDRIANSPASDMANYPDVEVSVINNKTTNNTTTTSSSTSSSSSSGSKTSNNSDSECNVLDNKLTTPLVTTTPANNNTTTHLNSDNNDDDDVVDNTTNTITDVKVNGQSDRVHSDEHEDEYTSDEEALVIDEECKKEEELADSGVKSSSTTTVTRKRVRSPSPRANFKGFKKRIIAKSIHYRKVVNDLKNASFYIDLKENKDGVQSEQQLEQQDLKRLNVLKPTSESVTRTTEPPRHKPAHTVSRPVTRRSTNKRRPSQKLTEYAQYLGLQPAVKFKCVKCSQSSFQSLSALNDHQRHCLSQPASSSSSSSSLAKSTSTTSGRGTTGGVASSSGGPTSTNFRVTRKVFLCSSCGTYYENCNLFLHMREVHRRYICLYCLGMFSLPEKLSHHLITKHNCAPNHYASAEDFLSSYTDSCFLVCCHCERVFSERDNFFDHICVERRTTSDRVCASCGVTGTNSAHLSTCKGGGLEVPSTSTTSVPGTKSNNTNSKGTVQHKTSTTTTSSRQSKVSKATATSSNKPVQQLVEHVTADSPSTSVLEPDKELETEVQEPAETEEMNATEHFMAAAASSPENIKEQDADREQPPLEETTSSKEPDTEDTSEAMCTEATSTESEPVQEKTNECEAGEPPVAKPMENDVTEENEEENQKKDMSPEQETTEAMVADEHPESETDKQDTKSSEVDEAGDEKKPDKEEPVLSESSDESVLSEAEPEQQSDALIDEKPKLQDTGEMNGSPVPSPADNTDINESAPLQETKDESEDAKESSDHHEEEQQQQHPPVEQETRKVPKVRLKLPPQSMVYSENESDDSEKLTMEVEDNGDSDEGSKTADDSQDKIMNGYDDHSAEEEYVPVAGEDVPIVELELEQPLDKFTMESLLRRCLGATIPTCVYCNHARKIAVNGKQLGLHAIAEHRFAATVNSITAEELIPASFVTRIKECLREVEAVYFCLDVKEDKQEQQDDDAVPVVTSSYKRVYECFQCRYVTTIHKELYLHNRKMHAKTILLCIMCKSNFYSYSELICHLCPGNYVLHSETMFRCCMCSANDLPSAFRLMVHLRKRHHTCDVCLEGCHNQSKLSNHVWKHKLHHLCYRCGIAYRNKPDITKHLFWKHGTESVLCKRCLQKKWPHVYHFCIPPASFVCEECSHSFTKAVYLKVHKRLHSQEKPHACTEAGCTERFISKKLQVKHEARHREPIPLEQAVNEDKVNEEPDTPMDTEESDPTKLTTVAEVKPEDAEHAQETAEEPKKSLIDVYDLPALNLSESDSESEDEKPKLTAVKAEEQEDEKKVDMISADDEKKMDLTNSEPVPTLDEDQKPVPILDGIWDNFKNYQATIEKRECFNPEPTQQPTTTELTGKCDEDMKLEPAEVEEEYPVPDLDAIMADHDYCLPPEPPQLAEPADGPLDKVKTDADSGMDHDYCTVGKNQETSNNNQTKGVADVVQDAGGDKKKSKSPKKKSTKHAGSSSSSDSSSDSESSSCTCGSNCSCSSSSGSSSSSSSSSDSDSSSSEGKRRLQARRDRRKERAAKRKKDTETSQPVRNTSPVDVVTTEDPPALPLLPVIELPIEESDLDTDETETDEDFYDEHPQRLANKIMAEKRNQLALLAAVAPVNNGGVIECSPPSTPNLPEPEPAPPQVEVTPTPPKKKVKAKKRKKKSRSSTPKHEPTHNIPEYQQQVNHRHRRRVMSPAVVHPVIAPTPLVQPIVIQSPQIVRLPMIVETPKLHQHQQQHNHGSGSETDSNVRSSKRRRVPNKFYGYSSDEDAHDKPGSTGKWRKSEISSSNTTVVHHVTGSPQFVPPITIKNIPSPAPIVEPLRAPVIHHEEPAEDSESDEEEEEEVAPVRKSSSDSSDNERNDDSDSDTGQLHISQPPPPPVLVAPAAPPIGYSAAAMAHHQAAAAAAAAGGERSNENLYCYCQCPYDEVSEMIACDGKDCAIEWFHFECVGIMVPPKGKWFCPDCRRKTLGGGAGPGGMAPGRSDFVQT